MKSIAVRKLKAMGYKKIMGKKIELYNFYELCSFLKMTSKGIKLK